MKIGKKIHRVESCSSTNDLASELALQGEEEGTAIIAEKQTKGRGTKGRFWHSKKAMGLYFSVILRPGKRDMSLLPLAAGLALRDALSETEGLPVELKWPNDLIYAGKKLGGILCEASFLGNEISYVILGIGLNVNQDEEDFPEAFRSHATSLKILLKKCIDADIFLSKLWKILDDWYGFCLEGKEAQIVRAFQEVSVFSIGEAVVVNTAKKRITGKYMGIDPHGRLLLQVRGIERSFLAAEVLEIKKESKEE